MLRFSCMIATVADRLSSIYEDIVPGGVCARLRLLITHKRASAIVCLPASDATQHKIRRRTTAPRQGCLSSSRMIAMKFRTPRTRRRRRLLRNEDSVRRTGGSKFQRGVKANCSGSVLLFAK
jgi:hypothetical protein